MSAKAPMTGLPPPTLFSSPMLSNWQSAVAKVATSPKESGDPFGQALGPVPLAFDDTMVAAAAAASHAFEVGEAGQPPPPPASTFERCARAVLRLAICKIRHDEQGMRDAQAQLAQWGDCDPRWAECMTEFLAHYAITRHADVPYRRWTSMDDFILDPPLPERCRIGIVGDWGTGDPRAQAVLEAVARQGVDVLVHLGDIYYSCTASEADRFYDTVRAVFPPASGVRILTLCGNHDMYSGGAPYYALLQRLGQPASFFCLRNRHWQVLAADTGYNDFDPRSRGGVASWVQDFDDRDDPYSELAWHRDKLSAAGGRRTILLSHHQPFTINSAIDGSKATNDRLLAQMGPDLDSIDLWLWGHEHNQVVYEPFRGVKRGRCVGASAIPVPRSEPLYATDPAIIGEVPSIGGADRQLTVDPASGLYNLGFAIVALDGETATETYFEVNVSSGAERALYAAAV